MKSRILIAALVVLFSATSSHAFLRGQEPVVLSGAELAELSDIPVDELFVCSLDGENWVQIPYQIDEVTPEGSFFDDDDGVLDDNDEIVFMAEDLGDSAAPHNWFSGCLPFRYEVKVTDPLNPGECGWIYIYHSIALTEDTTDYVFYTPDKILTECYVMDHVEAKPHITSTILVNPGAGGDSTDLIDRMKMRVLVDMPWPFPDTTLTEEDLNGFLEGVKDGRVRVIRQLGSVFLGDTSSNARSFYYKSCMKMSSISDTTGEESKQLIEIVNIRSSTDFNHELSGLVHYDNSGSSGNGPVNVDGVSDSLETTPLGSWWEIDHPTSGCVVAVTDSIPIPGTISLFYQDGDSDPSGRETGEDGLWGETGVFIEEPGDTSDVAMAGCTYILPAAQGNVGELYAERYQNPLVAEPVFQNRPITFIRGDADSDLNALMSDAIFILKYLYVPGSAVPSCNDAADVNDDGSIEMNDTVYLLKYLYVPESPPIPQPYPECGVDPGSDELDCGSHPCMELIRLLRP